MIKSLLVYINIIFLSLLGFFAADQVTVDASLPASANPGEDFTMTVTLKKGSVREFAKLQFLLPAGFTATNIDSKDGAFSFADQQVKVIWTALPSEAEFQVRFKIRTLATVSGTKTISGKFSYVMEGSKHEAICPVKSINIGAAAIAKTTPTKETTTTTAAQDVANTATKTESTTNTTTEKTAQQPAQTVVNKENTTDVKNTATETKSTSTAATSTATNTAIKETTTAVTDEKILVKRNLSSSNVKKGESFTVELSINKGGASGFAKIMETLPLGFVAEEVDAFGGIFSFQDGKVKILWMTMPASSEIKVKYKVTAGMDMSGTQNIEGFFSYLKESDGTNKKIAFENSQVTILEQNADAVVIAEPTKTEVENTTPTETAAVAKKEEVKEIAVVEVKKKEVVKKEATTKESTPVNIVEKGEEVKIAKKDKTRVKTPVATEELAAKDFGVSNPNQGLYYSVQICATKKQVDVSYFTKANNIVEKIYTMMHEGWHKYVVGEFNEYKEARDHREKVKNENKVVGPFVTAYNKGTRITVQEALMISGQKWIQ